MLDYKLRTSRPPSTHAGVQSEALTCPVCGERMHPETADLHALAEGWVIEQIRTEHPEWVQADGLCPRCLEHDRKLSP